MHMRTLGFALPASIYFIFQFILWIQMFYICWVELWLKLGWLQKLAGLRKTAGAGDEEVVSGFVEHRHFQIIAHNYFNKIIILV